MTLRIPDEMIQKAIDNGINTLTDDGTIFMVSQRVYGVLFYEEEDIKHYFTYYELLFNPNLKFLEYVFKHLKPTPAEGNENIAYTSYSIQRHLCMLTSSEEQTEYLKSIKL